jgi:metal transporter CNNM
LRQDSNLSLATILWGNVTINVLLTLLSNSVLAGIGAFAVCRQNISDLGLAI